MANKYIDINTLKFQLFEVHQLKELFKYERFKEHDEESVNMYLDAVKEFSDRELFPFIKEMDENPAYHKNGQVFVHKQVGEYMRKSGEMGLISAIFDYEFNGMQLPITAHNAATFIQDAANNHLPGYAGLTLGSTELITHFGSQELIDTYVPNMLAGKWQGTMCLTEPQAGSSLSDITTKATPTKENYYNINGQKIFISGGDYQHVENIIHLVLARVEGAPKGTKGISLFVVPKKRINSDGTFTNNDVQTVADFQKMGQRGYCTTHLGFGDTDDCRGYLVGQENEGLKYMFLLMNNARIGVGRGAVAIAMAAYQASLEYAQERPQGRKLSNAGKKNPNEEQCLIIEHPDVRRMLLLQKSIVEGGLSLVLLTSKYQDIVSATLDKEEKEKYNLLLELLTPIAKTYPSEAGIVSVNNAIQILGGYGFCTDFIVQQYYRDIRIFALYEGTTGIQSLDLLGRKTTMQNGKAIELLAVEIMKTIQNASKIDKLILYATNLGESLKLVQKVINHLMNFAKKGQFEKFLADANLFMELLSHLVISWQWLEMASHSTNAINKKENLYSDNFYISKIETMKFYFKYEFPKIKSLADSILNDDLVTIKTEKTFLF